MTPSRVADDAPRLADKIQWNEKKVSATDALPTTQAISTTDIPRVSNASPTLKPKFVSEDHPIDETQKLKVAVIGAGLAGVTAGVLLPAKVPGISLHIFEKNADVGGTWYENVYPGVRCDIPANVYQSTFDPNTQWSEEYAQGAEILAYWKNVAKKHNVYRYLRLKHKVEDATWDEKQSKWVINVKRLEDGEHYTENFDVIINAIGRFNAWKLPDYPGIKEFRGHLVHSSAWDPSFDPTGKRIAVIGNGASGIQVVANLQPKVKHLDHYARSPTWIAGSFGGEGSGRTLEPKYYAEELLKSFEDPETYFKFRKELESKFYTRFRTLFKGSEENIALREEFVKLMSARLRRKPELLDHIVPDFPPNCRRLTPGPGYLEALTEDNVSYISTPISHFTATSIITTNGEVREVDAVICCTGANINMLPPFRITANKVTLQEAWSPSPLTYLGFATPNFPNLLLIAGPHGTGHSGTVPNQVETQITYLARLLRKVQNQGIKKFSPSQEATDDFTEYSDHFFEKTVWTENCSSWANGGIPGGRIHGHWPGSASHANLVRQEPRWEDWIWQYGAGEQGEKKNRFAWLGNGWTVKERDGVGDTTAYLKSGKVDLRAHHELWFEGLEKPE